MNAKQLRQLAEIFKDEVEGAEEGVSTAETLRRISERITAMAVDGEESDDEDASGAFRVGDTVRAAGDIIGWNPTQVVPKGTLGTITASAGAEWVTVRFQGVPRDWRCHVVEVGT